MKIPAKGRMPEPSVQTICRQLQVLKSAPSHLPRSREVPRRSPLPYMSRNQDFAASDGTAALQRVELLAKVVEAGRKAGCARSPGTGGDVQSNGTVFACQFTQSNFQWKDLQTGDRRG